MISAGWDAHLDDPLSKLRVTSDAYGRIGEILRILALPTVIVQEGGYSLAAVAQAAPNLRTVSSCLHRYTPGEVGDKVSLCFRPENAVLSNEPRPYCQNSITVKVARRSRWQSDLGSALPSAVGARRKTMDEAMKKLEPFTLENVAEKITMPILVMHGECDSIVPSPLARKLFDRISSKDKELKIFTPEEGGAEHC